MPIDTLKQNDYKCVELIQNPDREPRIVKRYSGHPEPNLLENTRYIYRALDFFYDAFKDILVSPRPISIDLNRHQVEMEYLPNLQSAKRLTLLTAIRADSFFDRCYEIVDNRGFLRTIHDSVILTPKLNKLLSDDFPVALGFKGDLRENLVSFDDSLILADINSICIEPLGLSELILHAELYASFNLFKTLSASMSGLPFPRAFFLLSKLQREQISHAAVEVVSSKMHQHLQLTRYVKCRIANYFLSRVSNSKSLSS